MFYEVGEADFQLPPSSELGAGRGERILPISRDEQDASLHQQLRMVIYYCSSPHPLFPPYVISILMGQHLQRSPQLSASVHSYISSILTQDHPFFLCLSRLVLATMFVVCPWVFFHSVFMSSTLLGILDKVFWIHKIVSNCFGSCFLNSCRNTSLFQ
jgi:hypothetical protein